MSRFVSTRLVACSISLILAVSLLVSHPDVFGWISVLSLCALILFFAFTSQESFSRLVYTASFTNFLLIWRRAEHETQKRIMQERILLPMSKMTCAYCQSTLQTEAHYCHTCGRATDPLYEGSPCVLCSHLMPESALFCPRCAHEVQQTSRMGPSRGSLTWEVTNRTQPSLFVVSKHMNSIK